MDELTQNAAGERQALVDEICRLEIPLDDWAEIEKEIAAAHDNELT